MRSAKTIALDAVIPAKAQNRLDAPAPSSRHSRESGNPWSFARYSTYKDSAIPWLDNVPTHWDVKPIKAVASCNDDVLTESTDPTHEIIYVEISGVSSDRGVTEVQTLAFGAAPSRARRRVRDGDVLVSTVRTYLRAITPLSDPPENMIASTGFAVIRPRTVNSAFLGYMFRSEFLVAAIIARSVGVSYPAINASDLMRLSIPVPRSEEQVAIADFLDRETAKIDALIAEQEKLIVLLKEKRQALISHAVTKGLDPNAPMKDSGIEWLGQVPVHWGIRGLRTLASIVRGASPRPAGDPELFDGEFVPWVTVAEITKDESPDLTTTSNYLTEHGAQASRTFKAGTLLYSNSGATLGVPKLLRMDACANDGVVGFENLASTLSTDFLYWFLRALTPTIRDLVKQGSGQPNLNTDIVGSIRIGLPPVDDQVAIVDSIKATENAFSTLSAQCSGAIDLLKERRAALISAAVTGKIDVRNA